MSDQERIDAHHIPAEIIPYMTDSNYRELLQTLDYFGCVVVESEVVYLPSSIKESLSSKSTVSAEYLLSLYYSVSPEKPFMNAASIQDIEELLLSETMLNAMIASQKEAFLSEVQERNYAHTRPESSPWYNLETGTFSCPVQPDSPEWTMMTEQERIDAQRIPLEIIPYMSDSNCRELLQELKYFGCIIDNKGRTAFHPSSVEDILRFKWSISIDFLIDRYCAEEIKNFIQNRTMIYDIENVIQECIRESVATPEQEQRFLQEKEEKDIEKRKMSVYTTSPGYYQSDTLHFH